MDYDELRYKIRKMSRRSKVYRVLKEELMVLGYWKLKARGNPAKGYEVMVRRRDEEGKA